MLSLELRIVRRNYAARLWEMIEQPPMDAEPVIFAGHLGAVPGLRIRNPKFEPT